MDTPSLDLACKAVTVAESKDTALEILPAEERKERFIKMLRNGSESKVGTLREAGEGAARVRAKAKGSRKAEAEKGDRSARTGAKGTAIAATPRIASLHTTALREEERGNGRTGQRICLRKQSNAQRKKSRQWLWKL
jgi:hypothetical protein